MMTEREYILLLEPDLEDESGASTKKPFTRSRSRILILSTSINRHKAYVCSLSPREPTVSIGTPKNDDGSTTTAISKHPSFQGLHHPHALRHFTELPQHTPSSQSSCPHGNKEPSSSPFPSLLTKTPQPPPRKPTVCSDISSPTNRPSHHQVFIGLLTC